jgi:hypothetical protein
VLDRIACAGLFAPPRSSGAHFAVAEQARARGVKAAIILAPRFRGCRRARHEEGFRGRTGPRGRRANGVRRGRCLSSWPMVMRASEPPMKRWSRASSGEPVWQGAAGDGLAIARVERDSHSLRLS